MKIEKKDLDEASSVSQTGDTCNIIQLGITSFDSQPSRDRNLSQSSKVPTLEPNTTNLPYSNIFLAYSGKLRALADMVICTHAEWREWITQTQSVPNRLRSLLYDGASLRSYHRQANRPDSAGLRIMAPLNIFFPRLPGHITSDLQYRLKRSRPFSHHISPCNLQQDGC